MPPAVHIRTWAREDLDTYVELSNSAEVARGLVGFPHPLTIEMASRVFDYFLQAAQMPDGYPTEYAILHRGEVVGGIGLSAQLPPREHSAEVGYWIAPKHQGKGYATEALKLLTDDAFTESKLTRIYARVFTWNAKSMTVLAKAGYLLEGTSQLSCVCDGKLTHEAMFGTVKEPQSPPLWIRESSLRKPLT
jgi:[ribosomal protein S5]-alanine N-acetyltransferase